MGIVESVEQDRTFLVDFPFTSKGDSGLPIFKRSGNGHLLVGCNGYFVDRKQDLQREKVAGNPPYSGSLKQTTRVRSFIPSPVVRVRLERTYPTS